MRDMFEPPITHYLARQWLANDITASHRPRPFLLWKRCIACRRRWPCPEAKWASRELTRQGYTPTGTRS